MDSNTARSPNPRPGDWLALFLFADALLVFIGLKSDIVNQLIHRELVSTAGANTIGNVFLVLAAVAAAVTLFAARRALLWLAMWIAPGPVHGAAPLVAALAVLARRGIHVLARWVIPALRLPFLLLGAVLSYAWGLLGLSFTYFKKGGRFILTALWRVVTLLDHALAPGVKTLWRGLGKLMGLMLTGIIALLAIARRLLSLIVWPVRAVLRGAYLAVRWLAVNGAKAVAALSRYLWKGVLRGWRGLAKLVGLLLKGVVALLAIARRLLSLMVWPVRKVLRGAYLAAKWLAVKGARATASLSAYLWHGVLWVLPGLGKLMALLLIGSIALILIAAHVVELMAWLISWPVRAVLRGAYLAVRWLAMKGARATASLSAYLWHGVLWGWRRLAWLQGGLGRGIVALLGIAGRLLRLMVGPVWTFLQDAYLAVKWLTVNGAKAVAALLVYLWNWGADVLYPPLRLGVSWGLRGLGWLLGGLLRGIVALLFVTQDIFVLPFILLGKAARLLAPMVGPVGGVVEAILATLKWEFQKLLPLLSKTASTVHSIVSATMKLVAQRGMRWAILWATVGIAALSFVAGGVWVFVTHLSGLTVGLLAVLLIGGMLTPPARGLRGGLRAGYLAARRRDNPMRNGIWLGAAGLVLVGLVIWKVYSPNFGGGATGGPTATATPLDGFIRIGIASSSTKKTWMEQAKASFNDASKSDGRLQVNGKPVVVEFIQEEIEPGKFDHYRSGTMVADILSGKISPVVASPSEESWIADLNRSWKATRGREITTERAPALIRVPVVIALWESRGRALDCWPQAGPGCTWERIRDLAASADGWGKFGHPEWGRFKFGYGYVGESNSGTLTAILPCMVGANKTTGLTIDDVSSTNGCGQTIATVDQAKVHSGKKSGWLLGWMLNGGPEYLDAVTTNEPDVIAFNRANGAKLREPLVAAYPQDGTVVSTHPFAILDNSPWVTEERVAAAKLFRDYLLSAEQQRAALANGLRPADPKASIGAPIEPANGANPNAILAAVTVPDSLTVDRIIEVWHQVKKHAMIALVFDKSGSMAGEKLTAAITGAKGFVGAMDRQDWLVWMPFDDKVYPGAQGFKSQVGERLVSDIASTTAGSGTALYDAVAQAYRLLEAERKTRGDTVRYGIIILSDGKDSSSSQSTMALLEAMLKPAEGDPTGIQIHTIGIGADADKAILTTIAGDAHGKYWDAKDPANVVNIYREIIVYY